MPLIDLDLSETDIIDARVVVSFDRLTVILRNVVDASNQHHNDIAELQRLLKDEKSRGDELERLMKEDTTQNSIIEMTNEIEGLKKTLEQLKDEVDQNAHDASDNLKNHVSTLKEDIALNDEELKKQQESFGILQDQVNELLIPSQKHGISLEKQVAELMNFRNKNEALILASNSFVECWSAEPSKLIDLCEKNYEGRYVTSEQTRTDYILSLPPFVECSKQYKYSDEPYSNAYKDNTGGDGISVTNAELSLLTNEAKNQQQAVRNALRAYENSIKNHENLTRRVTAIEDVIRALGIQSNNVELFDMKGNDTKFETQGPYLDECRSDLKNTTDSLSMFETQGPNEELHRRVRDLETEVLSLGEKKVDRSELDNLYNRINVQGGGYEGGVQGVSCASVLEGGIRSRVIGLRSLNSRFNNNDGVDNSVNNNVDFDDANDIEGVLSDHSPTFADDKKDPVITKGKKNSGVKCSYSDSQKIDNNALTILDNSIKVQEDLTRRVTALEDVIRALGVHNLETNQIVNCPTCGTPTLRSSLNLNVLTGTITPQKLESVVNGAASSGNICPTCNNGYIPNESVCPLCGATRNYRVSNNNDNPSFSVGSRTISNAPKQSLRPRTVGSTPTHFSGDLTLDSSGRRSAIRTQVVGGSGPRTILNPIPQSSSVSTTSVRVFMGRSVATVRDCNGCTVPATIGGLHY